MGLSGLELYIFIFIAKTLEVTLTTIRLVYVNRGERIKGAVIGFFCALLLITVLGSVVSDLANDPFKIVAYSAGYALGNYLGVTIESMIAIGLSSIKVVVNEGMGNHLAEELREHGFGVTIMDCTGMKHHEKCLLLIQLKRKKIPKAIKLIKKINPDAYITVNDVKSTVGGYIKG